jgi:hypothetical protein
MNNFKNKYLLITITLLLCSKVIFAQLIYIQPKIKVDYKDLHAQQKKDTEPEFKVTKIPEKYINESYIVLVEKKIISDHKTFYYGRTRIKLNDLTSLETFSEFKFDEGDEFEIKIIKPDGKTTLVDLKDAVDDENISTSNKYINRLSFGRKNKKIALKNLEVGDIIDYSSYYRGTIIGVNGYALTYLVNINAAPILYLKNEYVLSKNKFAVIYKAFNGANDLVKKTKDNANTYTFEAKMIDKRKEEILTSTFISQPHYKLNLIALNYPGTKSFFPNLKSSNVSSHFSEKDCKFYAKRMFETNFEPGYNYINFMKANNGYSLSDENYVKGYYNYCRDKYFDNTYMFNQKPSNYGVGNLRLFINHLKKRNIYFEVIMFVSKYDGPIKDLIFERDIHFGLRYKIDKEFHYIASFEPFGNIDQFSEEFEGTEAYAIKNHESSKRIGLTKFTIPTTNHENNEIYTDIKAEFVSNTTDSLEIKSYSSYSGNYKIDNNRYLFVDHKKNYDNYTEPYFKQFRKGKNTTKWYRTYFFVSTSYKKVSKKFYVKEEERLTKDFYDDLTISKFKTMEKFAKENYFLLKFKKFEPLSDGKEKGEKIEYKEEFVIGNTIHSAGAKNVFEIGRIIGGLAEVDDNDDREDRKSSFIINFNKTYTVSMTIKIPDNKSIEGIELLNKNISNSVGTISSTAKIENGQIKWKIEKKLNAGVYESSIWTDYLKLTDFGSQLTTSKILLY